MAVFTSVEKQETLREAGRRLAGILKKVAAHVEPGVTTQELNDLAERLIREGGDTPSVLGYTPEGAPWPYPATLCVSVNEEIVHGIPSPDKVLHEGDLVGLDLVLTHRGVVADAAVTVPVGVADEAARRLLKTTQEALEAGIAVARVGNRIGDISHAMETVIRTQGYGIPVELGGHGVGNKVHEEPFISSIGKPGTGEKIVEGMVLALEPMCAEGKAAIRTDKDGYTVRMKDKSRSAHFEHTVLVTQERADVVTR